MSDLASGYGTEIGDATKTLTTGDTIRMTFDMTAKMFEYGKIPIDSTTYEKHGELSGCTTCTPPGSTNINSVDGTWGFHVCIRMLSSPSTNVAIS
jgi:hypothetical protein